MKAGKGGSSVGVVLMALTITMGLLFFSLSAGIQHLSLSRQIDRRARARDAAESVLHLTMAQLCKQESFGLAYAPGSVIRADPNTLAGDARGVLSFDKTVAASERIKFSTNNLLRENSSPGDGLVVPRRACHLIALGECGDQRMQIETVYVHPPFPTGCASKGPVNLDGVRLWGHPPGEAPALPLTPQPSVPAHVYTNQSGPNALSLGVGCEIFGDAAAVGGISLAADARVRGEVMENAPPGDIPGFNIADMWSRMSAYVGLVPYEPGQPVDSYCVINGGLNVADLEINGGVLAVNGDINVSGRLFGRGFILATGDVTANGGAVFNADRRLAVLSGRNLTLNGQGKQYTFNGLLYAKGQLRAKNLTVLGAVVCDGTNGDGSVRLEQMDIIQTPVAVSGGVAKPLLINFGDAALLNEESVVLNLQSYPDPADPSRMLFMGNLVYDGDEARGTPKWTRGSEEIRGITWVAPQAIYEEGESGFAPDGRPRWDPSKTSVRNFDGSATMLLQQALQLIDRRNHLKPRHITQVTNYVNALKLRGGSADTFWLDLNNLVPPVERIRLLTWKESVAP